MKQPEQNTSLKTEVTVPVRFSDVDSMGVVWHGHYIKFFEDGREAFGKAFGLTYLDCYRNGFVTPLVDINCEYKHPIRYGEEVVVEIVYKETPAAKIIHEYAVYRRSDRKLAATGRSVQVFVTIDGELQLNVPDFFLEWKKEQGLINS